MQSAFRVSAESFRKTASKLKNNQSVTLYYYVRFLMYKR